MKMFLVLIVAIGLATFCLPSFGDTAAAKKDTDPGTKSEAVHYTYVIVHGASGGGWDWRTMDELLTASGHTVYRPTLTGLGEKMHLANADINLTTHIDDIANVILFEDLDEVVLVGHSYGGMVITGVMDRLPDRIKHAVFLDAAVPDDGMSARDQWETIISEHQVVDGIVYFNWLDSNAPLPRDVPQSLKTLTDPVSFDHPAAQKIPATYIGFIPPGQTAKARAADPAWQRAEARNWTILTLQSDHNAQRSHPEELAAMLIAAP
jgi:pimeloyl-ACP methyl ester carboxylesterase